MKWLLLVNIVAVNIALGSLMYVIHLQQKQLRLVRLSLTSVMNWITQRIRIEIGEDNFISAIQKTIDQMVEDNPPDIDALLKK